MSYSNIRILLIIQVIISIVIVVSVLLQNRAEGLGSMFGGGGGEVFRTKRGLERFLYYGTIILTILFASLSLIIVKYTV